VLALATVVFLSFRHRFGHALSAVLSAVALTGLLLLGFAGSRSFSKDASFEGRTEAWYAGLQMLKDSPIWGVGLGFFRDYHERVAHNSFVHCFAELGLVGYFLWLAVIVLTVSDLGQRPAVGRPGGRTRRSARPDLDAEDRGW
jgi:O-antigen ligase